MIWTVCSCFETVHHKFLFQQDPVNKQFSPMNFMAKIDTWVIKNSLLFQSKLNLPEDYIMIKLSGSSVPWLLKSSTMCVRLPPPKCHLLLLTLVLFWDAICQIPANKEIKVTLSMAVDLQSNEFLLYDLKRG